MATHTTYTEAREHLATYLDLAGDDRETVYITRRGHGAVALIAAEELRSLEETAHLMRSPTNARRLLEALGRSIASDVTPLTIDELREQVGLTEELVAESP